MMNKRGFIKSATVIAGVTVVKPMTLANSFSASASVLQGNPDQKVKGKGEVILKKEFRARDD